MKSLSKWTQFFIGCLSRKLALDNGNNYILFQTLEGVKIKHEQGVKETDFAKFVEESFDMTQSFIPEDFGFNSIGKRAYLLTPTLDSKFEATYCLRYADDKTIQILRRPNGSEVFKIILEAPVFPSKFVARIIIDYLLSKDEEERN